MPTLSLDAIRQRITKQNSELQALRRELEARQNRLQSLALRKGELQAKLRQIEAEMAAIAAGGKRPQAPAAKAAARKPASTSSASAKAGPPSLNSLLLAALRSAGRPLTAKQLGSEVKRRGFKSESADFTKMVGSRLWDLKKQGIIRRATGQPGYSLASAADGPAQKPQPAKPGPIKAAAKPVPTQPAAGKVSRLTLRELVTQVLKKMGVPLPASELAEEVLKTGYQTNSKNFVNNIYAMIGLMENIEHVEGQGYRLRRKK